MASCTFIGHKDCSDKIKIKLKEMIEELIVNEGVNNFYVGTHGKFDYYAYESLCDLELKYDIKINVVLAYLNSREKFYDNIKTIFPYGLENTPKRYTIIKRNNYMIKKSQYMICYVNNSFSNAYKFLEIAEKNNLKIINIGEYKQKP